MDENIKGPISVAVTDDHQMWHDQLSAWLPDQGFIIALHAFNRRELLERLPSAAQLPDICLLDISMPVMDGYETARQLRRSFPSVKILAFSMDDDQHTRAAILEAGADGFLWKCCDPEELTGALLRLTVVRQ